MALSGLRPCDTCKSKAEMAEARKTYPKFVTPKLTLKFPKLTEPDYGTKDYPKPDGEYVTKAIARADDPTIKAFLDKLTALHREAVASGESEAKNLKIDSRKKLEAKNGKNLVAVNDLFTTVYDKETEEPTGEIEFKFAMPASGEFKKGPKAGQRWTRKPDFFDARGLPMRKVPDIWGGTVAKISFEAAPYFIPGTGFAGLKLRLLGVQVIELRQGGQRDASAHGFGAEEGGYVHDDNAAAVEDEAPAADSEDPGHTMQPEGPQDF